MISDAFQPAARQFLLDHPDLAYFYILYREYSFGSTGDSRFHALARDEESCREAIQGLCAQQQAEAAEVLAELAELPPDEEPYDPAMPDGCSASLCIVLPGKQSYVQIHTQRWNNQGHSHHSAEIPDIFDVVYYSDKVERGDYKPDRIKA